MERGEQPLELAQESRARGVEYHERVRDIVIDSREPVPWQADGDYMGETPLTVRVLPGALSLLVPEVRL